MALSEPELAFAPESPDLLLLLVLPEPAFEPESPELLELSEPSDLLDFVGLADSLEPDSLFLLSEEPFELDEPPLLLPLFL